MIEFPQLLLRFVVALSLGGLIGLERELVGKEAGVRTLMLIACGAAMFAMIALSLPSILGEDSRMVHDIIVTNASFVAIIANVVMAAGFIGAGIIIKTQEHVHGLTTAAMIWTTAGVGILVGIGMVEFAATVAIVITALLYLLRGLDFSREAPVTKKRQ